jgi:hypothetical protein
MHANLASNLSNIDKFVISYIPNAENPRIKFLISVVPNKINSNVITIYTTAAGIILGFKISP